VLTPDLGYPDLRILDLTRPNDIRRLLFLLSVTHPSGDMNRHIADLQYFTYLKTTDFSPWM
jgi:hypothetical protein